MSKYERLKRLDDATFKRVVGVMRANYELMVSVYEFKSESYMCHDKP